MNSCRIFLLAIIFCACTLHALAIDNIDKNAQIAALTTTILRKEISLERFYLKYKILAREEPKLRTLRYFLGQQTSLGLYLAGDIVTIKETGEHINSPENISTSTLTAALKTELIGGIIGGASSATELCSNAFIAWKNSRNKQNPGSVIAAIKVRLKEIHTLLKEREILVEQSNSDPAYNVYTTEGNLLRYYSDWCVYEFSKIYADAKSYQGGNNVYYCLSLAYNSLYSTAAYLAYRGPQYISSAIVTGMIGDGILILSAPASYFSDKVLKKYYFKRACKTLEEKLYDIDAASNEAVTRLRQQISEADYAMRSKIGPIGLRLAAYDLWSDKYDEYVNKETEQLRRYDKIALQSMIFGPIISGTFLTQDLLGAAAYYGNRNRLKTANNLALAGAITAGAGSAIGIGATTWYFVDEMKNQYKLKKEGKLPEQLIKQRLKTLDQIESMIGQ